MSLIGVKNVDIATYHGIGRPTVTNTVRRQKIDWTAISIREIVHMPILPERRMRLWYKYALQ